jgi:hypothetical protein
MANSRQRKLLGAGGLILSAAAAISEWSWRKTDLELYKATHFMFATPIEHPRCSICSSVMNASLLQVKYKWCRMICISDKKLHMAAWLKTERNVPISYLQQRNRITDDKSPRGILLQPDWQYRNFPTKIPPPPSRNEKCRKLYTSCHSLRLSRPRLDTRCCC